MENTPLYICCSPRSSDHLPMEKFERTEKQITRSTKAFRIREGAAVRRSAGLPGQQQNQVGESAKSIKRAHRRGRGTHSQQRHTQIRGGSRRDHSTSSWGPAASGAGPSAGGRLRRRTVEDRSLRQKTRAILLKLIGQQDHRRPTQRQLDK